MLSDEQVRAVAARCARERASEAIFASRKPDVRVDLDADRQADIAKIVAGSSTRPEPEREPVNVTKPAAPDPTPPVKAERRKFYRKGQNSAEYAVEIVRLHPGISFEGVRKHFVAEGYHPATAHSAIKRATNAGKIRRDLSGQFFQVTRLREMPAA